MSMVLERSFKGLGRAGNAEIDNQSVYFCSKLYFMTISYKEVKNNRQLKASTELSEQQFLHVIIKL